MGRARIIITGIWLLLSIWLIVWIAEKLLRTDQRASILFLPNELDVVLPLMIGIAWGFASMLLGVVILTRRRRIAHDLERMTAGTGRVIEVHRSGLSHERVEGAASDDLARDPPGGSAGRGGLPRCTCQR